LESIDDLEELVKPLIRPATRIEVQKPSRPPANSQFKSHFGGQPYFEKGESWPKTRSGEYLDFIFQIFNGPELELPESIRLIQFFYNWDEFPWSTDDDGWLVKIYKTADEDKVILIDQPIELESSHYCEIVFQPTQSLPDWEGIDVYSDPASKLSCILNEDEPWGSYDQMVKKIIGGQDYQSQLGGYPNWIQGESTPQDGKGNPMKLLFQIDSESNAGIMWGDVGMVYVFFDEKTERTEFILQCH